VKDISFIMPDDKIYRAVAKVANAVEKDDMFRMLLKH